MATCSKIVVIHDFGDRPYGRNPKHGPQNGQAFREKILYPRLLEFDQVEVDMSGAQYISSFLEEAFGGLVRFAYFTASELHQKLKVIHPLKSNVDRVWEYIDTAIYGSAELEKREMQARYR